MYGYMAVIIWFNLEHYVGKMPTNVAYIFGYWVFWLKFEGLV